jgi:FKBP-type peptidyl-prolyl cis-trans isomerase
MRVCGIVLILAAIAGCQEAPKKEIELNTDDQKFSYSLGYTIGQDMANGLKRQGINPDPEAFSAGVSDVLKGGSTLLTESEIKQVMESYKQKMMTKQMEDSQKSGQANRDVGEAFLTKNKAEDGVVELPSGLQYKVLNPGSGKSPGAADEVTVHYRGTLLDGSEFDSSYQRNEPATFPLNRVIKGWTEGLQLMKTGAKYKFFIPADLAYGDRDNPKIPAGSTLIFEVELLAVK